MHVQEALWCGMEPGLGEKGGWTWAGGQELALCVPPLWVEKSTEAENSNVNPAFQVVVRVGGYSILG